MTLTCERHLGSPHRSFTEGYKFEITDDIICDIFDGGNFVKKKPEQCNEGMPISDRGKNRVGRSSLLRQFFISMTATIKINWPISRKIQLLIPVGYGYYIMRYIIRILAGKRKYVSFSRMVEEAGARRNVYEKFKLFEKRIREVHL